MTNHIPKVSIIIACYNSQTTIARTINSILCQSFNNWELVIVDDCSTDNSAEVIKSYAEKDSRIIYLKTDQNTCSPSSPRNIGIEYATGQYITFVDSDDIWLPDKLDMQIREIENYGYDLVYSYYEKVNHKYKRKNRVVKTKESVNYNDMLKSNHIPLLTAMIRKSDISDIRFKNIPNEDYCFWLDILKKGITAHNIGEVTALYRVSKRSRSSNKWKMAHGFWHIIRHHQKIGFTRSCIYMVSYIIIGLSKYIK